MSRTKRGGDLPMEGVIYPLGGGDLPHQNTSPRAPVGAKKRVKGKRYKISFLVKRFYFDPCSRKFKAFRREEN